MSIVALLAGITLIITGVLIWKFKLVEILTGYNPNTDIDNNRLATMAGLTLFL